MRLSIKKCLVVTVMLASVAPIGPLRAESDGADKADYSVRVDFDNVGGL